MTTVSVVVADDDDKEHGDDMMMTIMMSKHMKNKGMSDPCRNGDWQAGSASQCAEHRGIAGSW